MCNCYSYNLDCERGSDKESNKTLFHKGRLLCIDSCIADMLEEIWAAGIETTSCCCGHEKGDRDGHIFLEDFTYTSEGKPHRNFKEELRVVQEIQNKHGRSIPIGAWVRLEGLTPSSSDVLENLKGFKMGKNDFGAILCDKCGSEMEEKSSYTYEGLNGEIHTLSAHCGDYFVCGSCGEETVSGGLWGRVAEIMDEEERRRNCNEH